MLLSCAIRLPLLSLRRRLKMTCRPRNQDIGALSVACMRCARTAVGLRVRGQHSAREAYQWSVNVSVYVHPQARRRGIGGALYRVLFSILRLQGFYSAYAGITLPNAASTSLHESLGFTPVGAYERVGFKLGTWHDVGYWQLALQPRKGEPSPPQSLPSILKSPLLPRELKAGSVGLTFQSQKIAGLFDAAHLPNQE